MCVTDTANDGYSIPAGETVLDKIVKSTNHRRRRCTLAQKVIISLMLLVPSADSEALAVCCEESREYCERWMTPLAVCLERVGRGDLLIIRGKGKGDGRICEVCLGVKHRYAGRRRTHHEGIDNDSSIASLQTTMMTHLLQKVRVRAKTRVRIRARVKQLKDPM